VPADGVVTAGASSTDESLLTGESRPVDKAFGSTLIGGSINIGQPLELRVTHAGMETQAAAIGRLIERAAAGKPKLVESADRIAHTLTWVVLAAAGATLLVWLAIDPPRAFWAAIAVLMVTCPCALGLAAPIALTSATAALARRGIVLTRAQAIETMVGITDVVLDKTGTLTEGRPGLAHFDAQGTESYEACLGLAQALEAGSRHPVAGALLALPRGARTGTPTHMTHFPGSGIEATVEGRRIRIGTQRFVQELAGDLQGLAVAGAHQSPVFLGSDAGWLGRFLFEDHLRPDAVALVKGLQAQGLQVHLLSGDDPAVVREVARSLGLATAQGATSPQDKHDYVRQLQAGGRRVCMIGDGLNDAPVLAQADLSIAMGQGAALAQQQADLVLLSGRLDGVLEAGRIARLAMAAIRQNFAWALAYNVLALPAAAFGLIGPWEAAIGMAASSFVVVLNSARLAAALRG
jgi:Cu2+-exporting ATPase